MMTAKNMCARLTWCAFTVLAALASLLSAQTPMVSPSPAPTSSVSVLSVRDSKTLDRGERAFDDTYRKPEVRTEYLASKLMGRQMPYNVILPIGYDLKERNGQQYPVVYLLHGLSGHFENWIQRTSLVDYAASFKMIIVTPEGEDGWYTDNLTQENQQYESYIVKELIPAIDKKFRTLDRREHRAIAGLSMGGFGAIKFGLKYPDMFVIVGSFSGAIGAATITEKQFPGAISKTINTIFGPFGGEVRKANDPFDIVRRATPEKIKAFPFLYLDCGTEDFLFQSNREFVSLLLEKKVPHEFRQLPGAHTWKFWDKQVLEFLRISDRFLN
ncbi:MAG: alpha/beta hydrolase family protein [Pyrinomonadaceae bacterium]